MTFLHTEAFALKNFEGPLDFLLCLIQREEILTKDVSLKELTGQFLQKLYEWQEKQIEKGAEFIGLAAYLIWLKSKDILPSQQEQEVISEEMDDPRFEIIHHLIDYCRFKYATKELIKREEVERTSFFRGLPDTYECKKPFGISHISLDDLSQLFRELLEKAPLPPPPIQAEQWKVSDKMVIIEQFLTEKEYFLINHLFLAGQPKIEWIISFLALLEMMKRGKVYVARREDDQQIYVFCKEIEE